MTCTNYPPNPEVALFVKEIQVYEQPENGRPNVLPFYADGYPGLLFHITPNGHWVHPHDKFMPVAYLYGQTLEPIEIRMHGAYKIVIFQLYPFVINSFFGVDPKMLNDACFDLLNIPDWAAVEPGLLSEANTSAQIEAIQSFLYGLFHSQKEKLDYSVRQAVQLILEAKSQISVTELSERLHLTVRTFERRFVKETGIHARDFIQITRFQQSLAQLTVKDYSKISDVVYANGYADQSHFIRVFKAFTGQTPKQFVK